LITKRSFGAVHNEEIISVLIAEDSEIINNNIKTVLSFEKNIEVIGQVGSGKDAVNFTKSRKPSVILMDIEMEEKRDGIDAVAEIMDMYPQTKIVMLTVQEDEDSILSSFEAGACDYVLKSASAKEIIDAVEAAYNNCSPIRPVIAGKIRKQIKHIKMLKDNIYGVINIMTKLTPTERSILIDVLDGKKQKEIAEVKHIEISTVKTHVKNILKKFRVKKMSEVTDILERNDIDKISKR
jgi:DNA-binding NarL/FixJ family response regulator